MITLDDAIARVKPIVDANPDYVYDGEAQFGFCAYVDRDGNPSCLIGQAFPDELRRLLDSDTPLGGSLFYSSYNEKLIVALLTDGELHADTDAHRFLSELQHLQDRKIPWGEAYKLALEYTERQHGAD